MADAARGRGRPPALSVEDRSLLIELRRVSNCTAEQLLVVLQGRAQLPGFKGASKETLKTLFRGAGVAAVRKSPLRNPYAPGYFVVHVVPAITDDANAQDEGKRPDLAFFWEPFSHAMFAAMAPSFKVSVQAGADAEEEPLYRFIKHALSSLPGVLSDQLQTAVITQPTMTGGHWFLTQNGNASVLALLSQEKGPHGLRVPNCYTDIQTGEVEPVDLRPYLQASQLSAGNLLRRLIDQYNLNSKNSPPPPLWDGVSGTQAIKRTGDSKQSLGRCFHEGPYLALTPQERIYTAFCTLPGGARAPARREEDPRTRDAIREVMRQGSES